MAHGLHDGLGPDVRVFGLEDARAHEHAVGAQVHHEGGVSRGGYPAGGEVDHREPLELGGLLQEVRRGPKLAGYGVELEDWQVINSAEATAHYLQQRFPGGGPVFVVGESGLQQTLSERGFYHSETSERALAVVASMDRTINYEKLSKATLLIRAGAEFIGTNPDRSFPDKRGILPGAGSILALLEAASDVKPTIIGKPAPEMYQVALLRLHTTPQETLVVGDRLETDIAGAQLLGCRSALVLTGVTSEADAHQWTPAPDLIASDLTRLLHML